jgi:hypothetical protein
MTFFRHAKTHASFVRKLLVVMLPKRIKQDDRASRQHETDAKGKQGVFKRNDYAEALRAISIDGSKRMNCSQKDH